MLLDVIRVSFDGRRFIAKVVMKGGCAVLCTYVPIYTYVGTQEQTVTINIKVFYKSAFPYQMLI